MKNGNWQMAAVASATGRPISPANVVKTDLKYCNNMIQFLFGSTLFLLWVSDVNANSFDRKISNQCSIVWGLFFECVKDPPLPYSYSFLQKVSNETNFFFSKYFFFYFSFLFLPPPFHFLLFHPRLVFPKLPFFFFLFTSVFAQFCFLLFFFLLGFFLWFCKKFWFSESF